MSSNAFWNHSWKHPSFVPLQLLAVALVASICQPAFASSNCVNPGGKGGCHSTIAAAVAAASPGSTIKVAPGTYKEDVVIGKSLSLIGAGSSDTIIDATGLNNAIYVDGLDNPGLRNVSISGFTVENAKFEGLLVTNATNVTILSNYAHDNNTNLDLTTDTCIDPPPYLTGESFDCGEGFHIMGVSWSTFANNVSQNNSGGFLISDDTGETHDNLINGNLLKGNPFACGIVLASHAPYMGTEGPTGPHNGIVHNTITNNTSARNGYQTPGTGAGVGIFSDGSGVGTVSVNIVINNVLTNNGLPGVAFHSHVGPHFGLPPDNLNDNIIIGNHISGNGPDVGDTPTPGPTGINLNSGGGGTPITGTVIWGNIIENEDDDVVINTPAEVDLHFNNLLGGGIGVDNLSPGTVNATNNYWGCFAGPTSSKCSSVSGTGVVFVPFLRIPLL